MAYTIDGERRQGLSSILNIKLAEKVFQMQDRVFCTVLKSNVKSINLLTKLGYRTICDEYWHFN
jgi:ribosomal protein S18 acetylase RimI-like enzyme